MFTVVQGAALFAVIVRNRGVTSNNATDYERGVRNVGRRHGFDETQISGMMEDR